MCISGLLRRGKVGQNRLIMTYLLAIMTLHVATTHVEQVSAHSKKWFI